MGQKINELKVGKASAVGLIGVTLVVWTSGLAEPVGMPKLAILAPFSLVLLGLLLPGTKELIRTQKTTSALLLVFVVWLGIAAIVSANPLSRSFYGVEARNTGWLTYFSFSLVLFAMLSLVRIKSRLFIYWAFGFVGLINVLYSAYVLVSDKDPIPWNNVYGTILGTFGNPNFISSFLGFFATALFLYTLSPSKIIWLKILSLAFMAVTIIEILETNSIQGLVVLALGMGLSLGVFLKLKVKKSSITIPYFVLLFASGVVGVLGTLQKGPLASILYKDSVSYRGEYWFAGLRMIKENPFFGLGPDSYGNWYRQYRDLSSTVRPGVETTANTAHNVFIDIGVSGGIPVLAAYVGICALVLLKILRVFRKSSEFDPVFWTFAIVWICYQAQSLISINQIGLAIWGWVFAGLVLSYEEDSSFTSEIKLRTDVSQAKKANSIDSGEGVVLAAVGGLAGILMVIPPLASDHAWRVGLEVSDANVLDEALEKWPRESNRLVIGSSIFANNNLNDFALKFARLAVEHDPNNFDSWRILSKTPGVSAEELSTAQAEMKRLDPLNPELK
jgi:O-antigen ligase